MITTCTSELNKATVPSSYGTFTNQGYTLPTTDTALNQIREAEKLSEKQKYDLFIKNNFAFAAKESNLYKLFPVLYKMFNSFALICRNPAERWSITGFFYFAAQLSLASIAWTLSVFKTISSGSGRRQAVIDSWKHIFDFFDQCDADISKNFINMWLWITGHTGNWANMETCYATRGNALWDLYTKLSLQLDYRYSTKSSVKSKSCGEKFLWALKHSNRLPFFWYYLGRYGIETTKKSIENDNSIPAENKQFFPEYYNLIPYSAPSLEDKNDCCSRFVVGLLEYIEPLIFLLNFLLYSLLDIIKLLLYTFILPFVMLEKIVSCCCRCNLNIFGKAHEKLTNLIQPFSKRFWALEYLFAPLLFGAGLYVFSGILGSAGFIDTVYSLWCLVKYKKFTLEKANLGAWSTLVKCIVNPLTISAAVGTYYAFSARNSKSNSYKKLKVSYAEELGIEREEADTTAKNWTARWLGVDSNSWFQAFLVLYSLVGAAVFTLYRVTKSLRDLGVTVWPSVGITIAASVAVVDMWQTTAIPSTHDKIKKLCKCDCGALFDISLKEQAKDHREKYGKIEGYSCKAWVSLISSLIPWPTFGFLAMATPLFLFNFIPFLNLLPLLGSGLFFGLDGINSGLCAIAGAAQLVQLAFDLLGTFGVVASLSNPIALGITLLVGLILAIPNIIVAVAFTDLKALKNRFHENLERVDWASNCWSHLFRQPKSSYPPIATNDDSTAEKRINYESVYSSTKTQLSAQCN